MLKQNTTKKSLRSKTGKRSPGESVRLSIEPQNGWVLEVNLTNFQTLVLIYTMLEDIYGISSTDIRISLRP